MLKTFTRAAPAALVLSLGLALAGCGGMPTNQSLESVHQPVVERTNYALDLSAGPEGLSAGEQRRLGDWFDAMNLRYGDQIAIDDPLQSSATFATVSAVASRYGLLVSPDAPPTVGVVNAGNARVIVTRMVAHVPGCPDWSANSETNLRNGTSSNYGCATNANLAAMVANPEHLLRGASGSAGGTVVMSGNKAIETYRKAEPTGAKGLKEVKTQEGGK